jgi:2-haloacid dehalogenase
MADERRVSTVIFDLGGVLIDWNPRYLYRKLFVDDEPKMERFLTEVTTAAWNHSLDAGKPFAEGVAELIAKHPVERKRIEAYHSRWIETISGPILGTVEILEDLAERKVPLYAITNWAAETFDIVRRDPAYAFLDLFREIYVSGSLRMAKPEPAIFHHALGRIGGEASDCLFIDDVEKNIRAAAALGITVHHFTSPEGLAADLQQRGLLA